MIPKKQHSQQQRQKGMDWSAERRRRKRKQAMYKKRDEERQKRMDAELSNTIAEDAAGPSHQPPPTAAPAPPPVLMDSQPATQPPPPPSPNLLLDSTEEDEDGDEEDHCAGSAMQRAVDSFPFGEETEKKNGGILNHDEMEGPIAFVDIVNKASPLSSISMLQTPVSCPTDSPSKKRSAGEQKSTIPSSKKNIFGATKTDTQRPLLLLGKIAGYGTDISSDEDDDLFRVHFDRPPKAAGAVPPATAIITLAKEPRSRSYSFPPLDYKARGQTIWEHLDSSSDDSDNNGGGFLARKRRKTSTMFFHNTNNPTLKKDSPFPETATTSATIVPSVSTSFHVAAAAASAPNDIVMTDLMGAVTDMGSTAAVLPGGSTEERRRRIEEVRAHLDLLKEFEGAVPESEINQRKRELFAILLSLSGSLATSTSN
jgi:hypothetical protein